MDEKYNFVSLIAIGKPVKERNCAPKKDVASILKII